MNFDPNRIPDDPFHPQNEAPVRAQTPVKVETPTTQTAQPARRSRMERRNTPVREAPAEPVSYAPPNVQSAYQPPVSQTQPQLQAPDHSPQQSVFAPPPTYRRTQTQPPQQGYMQMPTRPMVQKAQVDFSQSAPQPMTPYGLGYPMPPQQMQPNSPVQQAAQWQVQTEEKEEAQESAKPSHLKPLLGVLAGLAVIAALVFWVMGLVYQARTQAVLDARAAAEEALLTAYPIRYQTLIEEKAQKYGLSPAFVAAIMLNESSFKPEATSNVGARGLMQLMDDTAQWIYGKMDVDWEYNFDRLYEPEINAEFGCWYLSFLSDRFRGDPVLVAAAFHAGQGEVQNWLNNSAYSLDHLTIKQENLPDGPTKQYVGRVVRSFAAYKRLYYGG